METCGFHLECKNNFEEKQKHETTQTQSSSLTMTPKLKLLNTAITDHVIATVILIKSAKKIENIASKHYFLD